MNIAYDFASSFAFFLNYTLVREFFRSLFFPNLLARNNKCQKMTEIDTKIVFNWKQVGFQLRTIVGDLASDENG